VTGVFGGGGGDFTGEASMSMDAYQKTTVKWKVHIEGIGN